MLDKITKRLDNYLTHNKNVLLIGRHGVGKTAIVKDLFSQHFGENYKYFSTATIDPWTDFCGVPNKITDENGDYLDMVMPKYFRKENQVEAIFLDEFNRSPAKVRNACMELLQFKSLNGNKFDNLKVIWACINPEEGDEYEVEKLDPAIRDRFEIIIDMPYLLNINYFKTKYPTFAEGAIEWWQDLDKETQYKVSPRRLEYAIETYDIKGDLHDVLDKSLNISKLTDAFKNGTLKSQLDKLKQIKDESEILKTLKKSTNLMTAIKENLNNQDYVEKFAHLLPEEVIVEKAPLNFDLCTHIKTHSNKFETSLISTLDGMGCFKKSDFRVVTTLIAKEFPNNNYDSRKRIKLKKILKVLPDLNNSTITQSEVPALQNLLTVVGEYVRRCNANTVNKDDKELNFFEKFSNIRKMNISQSLGLSFDYRLDYYLNNFEAQQENNKKVQAFNMQGQVLTQNSNQTWTVMSPTGPVSGVITT